MDSRPPNFYISRRDHEVLMRGLGQLAERAMEESSPAWRGLYEDAMRLHEQLESARFRLARTWR